MKFTTSRENLLTPLQQVAGVIEKKQTLPILSNVLIRLADDRLEFIGTDLEVQLVTHSLADAGEDGQTTVPARKLLDIIRLLPEGSPVKLECRGDKLAVHSGRSRFSLGILPAENYPAFDAGDPEVELSLRSHTLRKAMEKTLYAMALQDVRYYLNGLLLELEEQTLRAVASDGHRMALYEERLEDAVVEPRQVIIPRKGVLELFRLLDDQDELVTLQIALNNIRVLTGELSFSAKLIEGRYPDVRRLMPRDIARVIHIGRDTFKAALNRVAVLSTEKVKGVSLEVWDNLMNLQSQNPEYDEAEEELEVRLEGEGLAMSFNASYLLDAVNNMDSENMTLSFTESANSCLIEDPQNQKYKFIVMPMRL